LLQLSSIPHPERARKRPVEGRNHPRCNMLSKGVPMSFLLGLILFILGSVLVAVCLVAIPGPGGAAPAQQAHGHDAHGAHH
jgi:hypothetical protein